MSPKPYFDYFTDDDDFESEEDNSTCGCGNPAVTHLTYQFTAPSGYQSSVDIHACLNCGPEALREAAKQIQAWADVMAKGE